MIELDDILYSLTHLGPDKYPIKLRLFNSLLSDFGLEKYEVLIARDMLAVAGHIEYVLNNGEGYYRLRKPSLNLAGNGTYILSGARSEKQELIPTNKINGNIWNIFGKSCSQPKVLSVDKVTLNALGGELQNSLVIDDTPWSIPDINLPAWEEHVLQGNSSITRDLQGLLEEIDYQTDRIFNPSTRDFESMDSASTIIDNTGPVFLVRKNSFIPIYLFITKIDDRFKIVFLPSGRNNIDWSKLMICAAYGIDDLFVVNGDDLVVNAPRFGKGSLKIPIELEISLVQYNGVLPEVFGGNTVYKGIGFEHANKIISFCVQSFVSTILYQQNSS